MTIASRLKNIRESLGYSQRDMVKAIGSSLGAFQAYEAGKSVPGGNVLEAIARLGFNVNWLLTGEGPMKLEEMEENQVRLDEKLLEEIIIAAVKFQKGDGNETYNILRDSLARDTASSIINTYKTLHEYKLKKTPRKEVLNNIVASLSDLTGKLSGVDDPEAKEIANFLREILAEANLTKKT